MTNLKCLQACVKKCGFNFSPYDIFIYQTQHTYIQNNIEKKLQLKRRKVCTQPRSCNIEQDRKLIHQSENLWLNLSFIHIHLQPPRRNIIKASYMPILYNIIIVRFHLATCLGKWQYRSLNEKFYFFVQKVNKLMTFVSFFTFFSNA